MANISQVLYHEMPGKASELREAGLELNRQVVAVYNAVNEMRVHWSGARYNELSTAFNELRPLFNSILGLVVGTFPTTIEQVANNYAVVDTGAKICEVKEEPLIVFSDVEQTNASEFRFIQSEVEQVKNNVTQNFKYMIEQMNTIDSIIGQIPWDSDAATTFRETFVQLKDQIISKIDDVQVKFDTSMNQTIADVQRSENANQGQSM